MRQFDGSLRSGARTIDGSRPSTDAECDAGIYTRDVVHDQLAPQKIYFPEKGDELPPELNQYAGQQVDTGPEAKAYADDYIGAHLEASARARATPRSRASS